LYAQAEIAVNDGNAGLYVQGEPDVRISANAGEDGPYVRSSANADEARPYAQSSAAGQSGSAELFERAGNYELALHEYKRCKFFALYTGIETEPLVLYGMARCLYKLGKSGAAYDELQEYLRTDPLYTAELCGFELKVLKKAGYPGLSKIRLMLLAHNLSSDFDAYRSVLAANIECAAVAGSWDTVLLYCSQMESAHFLSAADIKKIESEIASFCGRKPRSLKAAAVFSAVLPGSGQLYAGFPLDAFKSFAVNAAVIGGTTAAVLSGEWVPAVCVGLPLTAQFYVKGIENASDAAEERNSLELQKTAARIMAVIQEAERGATIQL
jgi:tetratricopeptide (TPR) repeat protein